MLRTHRQRVPAMLAVACVGMLFYAVAGAAPGDGRELAPAETTAPAAKSDKPTSTTEKGDKSSSTDKDACGGSKTPTTDKGGKDDPKDDKGSTPTTDKDGKDAPKDDSKDSDSTSTTKDGKDAPKDDSKDSDSTSTTKDGKDAPKDDPDSSKASVNKDMSTAAAVKGGSTTADKGDSNSSKDDCKTTSTTRKDRDPSDKNDDKTTDTTRRGGKDSTTTTTDRDRDKTPSNDKPDTVEPSAPSDSGSDGGDSGGSTDPGATPIRPQEAPPEASPDSGAPVDDPQWAEDPGPADDGGWYDVPDEGPVDFEEDEEIALMAAPGAPEPVLPTFGFSGGLSQAPASRPSRSSGRTQELAAPPMVVSSSGSVQAAAGMTESQAVSRRLPGMQTSVTESAFPASIISTPKIFPVNRRDPLAAAALVLLVGVSRELFKVWRRRATDYWPA